MKKVLISCGLIFFVNLAFAQYGWTDAVVHLKNGKVLNGEARISMMSAGINLAKEKLKFRTKDKKNKSKYKPEDIDYAIFTINYKERVNRKRVEKTRTEKYISVYLNKNQTKMGFVELMVDGDLRLVGRTVAVQSGGHFTPGVGAGAAPVFTPGFMGSHNQVMFLKAGEKPKVFNQVSLTKSFRKRAMKYFEDCPVLQSKIDRKKFVKEDLQAIVKFYNASCR